MEYNVENMENNVENMKNNVENSVESSERDGSICHAPIASGDNEGPERWTEDDRGRLVRQWRQEQSDYPRGQPALTLTKN